MANYKDSQKISFSKEEERRFRQLFNKWGTSIKGYDKNHLGDELKIIEVWDTPLYRGYVKTQYDNRTLKNTHERVGDRKFPPKTIDNESQIDRWKIVPYSSTYSSKEDFYHVPGSEHITGCPTCHATGKVICPECGGKGVIAQKITIKEECPVCYGRGYKTENKEYFDYERVWDNYQEKYVLRHVRKTREDRKTCYKCNGTGKIETFSYKEIPCKTCGTTGKVTCSTCGGDKQILRFWQLRRIQYIENYVDYRFPSLIENDDAAKMSKLIDDSIHWTVVEKVHVDRDDFKSSQLFSRPVVGAMLSALCGSIKRPMNTAICFSDVEICECNAKTVIYEAEGHRFTCMLVGNEWKLFTVTSPISQRMDDLKTRVNRYCSKRMYGKAWEVLQKVNKYPQAGSNEAYMQQQLEERMSISSKFGANLSIVIASILSAPIFYVLYTQYDFFAPWSSWMLDKWNISTTLITIISLIFVMYNGMKSRKRKMPPFTYRSPSTAMRFIRGFILGIWHFIVYSAVTLLLAHIGILPLVAGAMLLAITIIAMIIILIAGIF